MWKIALICFLFTWTLTTHGKYSVTGDEPHYLMVTHSLVHDRDLDLANNYAHDDGRWFGHERLQAGPHARIARTGQLLSVHDIGLPMLLVPVYIVAERIATIPSAGLLARFRMSRGLFAYSIISLFLILVTTRAMTLVAEGLAASIAPTTAALLVVVAAISPPVVSHAFLVFPEVPALVVTAIVVWFVTKVQEPQDRVTIVWLIAMVGCLPWAHRKYSLYACGLLFVLLWMARTARDEMSRPHRWLAAALFLLPQAAFHAWTWREWGTLSGPQLSEALPFTLAAFKNGLVGLWLDRQSGLLSYAPVYWLLPACWAMTWRRTWPFIVPALLLYLPMAAFIEWWGGFSPAARYLVPIVPLCAVPVAAALRRTGIKIGAAALVVPQVAIDIIVWQHPRALWPQDSGLNPALESLGAAGRAYERLLPPIRSDGVTLPAILIVIVMIGIVAAALRFAPRDDEVRPWPPGGGVAPA